MPIYAGFEGTSAPDRNIALTLLFVTSWLGFPLFSVFLGNVFAAFNPWNAIAAPVGEAYRRVAGRAPAHFEYPEKLGRWPAAVGLAAFVWLELIHGTGGGVPVGVEPESVARAASYYTAYTLAMIAAFGREKWFGKRRDFLGLLRNVRLARQVRVPGRSPRRAALPGRLDPLGRRCPARSP